MLVGHDGWQFAKTFAAQRDSPLAGKDSQGLEDRLHDVRKAAGGKLRRGAQSLDAIADLFQAVLDATGSELHDLDHLLAQLLARPRSGDINLGKISEDSSQFIVQQLGPREHRLVKVSEIMADIRDQARHLSQLHLLKQVSLLDGHGGKGGDNGQKGEIIFVELAVPLVDELQDPDRTDLP